MSANKRITYSRRCRRWCSSFCPWKSFFFMAETEWGNCHEKLGVAHPLSLKLNSGHFERQVMNSNNNSSTDLLFCALFQRKDTLHGVELRDYSLYCMIWQRQGNIVVTHPLLYIMNCLSWDPTIGLFTQRIGTMFMFSRLKIPLPVETQRKPRLV